MTDPVAQRLRRELATTLTRLRSLDVERDEAPGITGATAAEFVDSAQAIEQRELGQLAAMRLADRARRLRTALARVERGEYGICEQCGADIADARLAVLPDVTTCLGCQEWLERSLAPSVVTVRTTACGTGRLTAAGARARRRRGRGA